MIFDKDKLHVTAMSEGGIFTKFKSLENGWKHKYYSKLKIIILVYLILTAKYQLSQNYLLCDITLQASVQKKDFF